MSFALDPLAAPGAEIRRLLVEQVQVACLALAHVEIPEELFRARKATRRARAVLRLAQGGLQGDDRRAVRRGLREVSRALSVPRDAHVVRGLLAEHRLQPRTSTQPGVVQPAVVTWCHRELLTLEPLLARMPLQVRDRDVIKGFTRGYRVARRSMVIARSEPSDENLHMWRKHIKTLRYHLQVLTPLWPTVLAPLMAEAVAVQSALGTHRDLMLLERAVNALPPSLSALQQQKAQQAFARGGLLLAAQDRLMGAWLRALWEQHRMEQW